MVDFFYIAQKLQGIFDCKTPRNRFYLHQISLRTFADLCLLQTHSLLCKQDFPACFLFYSSLYGILVSFTTNKITLICLSLAYEEILPTPWLTQVCFMQISLIRNLKRFPFLIEHIL